MCPTLPTPSSESCGAVCIELLADVSICITEERTRPKIVELYYDSGNSLSFSDQPTWHHPSHDNPSHKYHPRLIWGIWFYLHALIKENWLKGRIVGETFISRRKIHILGLRNNFGAPCLLGKFGTHNWCEISHPFLFTLLTFWTPWIQ